MIASTGDLLSAIKVTAVIPSRWPIIGIAPQTKTTSAIAAG